MSNKDMKLNILIVDDVSKNIRIVAGILKEEGYHLAFAEDGQSALDMVKKRHFDLILLDIMMPEMDGFEICQHLKKDPTTKDIPIIFLTAKDDTENIVKGFELGAMDYVTKPFNGTELLARVKIHLELNRSRQELKYHKEKFRLLAILDDLTGLYNTRYLYQNLTELINKSSYSNEPFSLIFMDMDNFKRVVDTYGHLNGSRALQEVAATIRETLDDPAYGVAYGGDEFVVVLPGFNKSQAIQKAEDIRSLMSQTFYLSSKGHQVSLSASFGVATYPDDAGDMTNLLASADMAMFNVKGTGKNAISGGIKSNL